MTTTQSSLSTSEDSQSRSLCVWRNSRIVLPDRCQLQREQRTSAPDVMQPIWAQGPVATDHAGAANSHFCSERRNDIGIAAANTRAGRIKAAEGQAAFVHSSWVTRRPWLD